jgi:hypothetical protein
MLSLKKTCLEVISRTSKNGNTAVLGPQLFLPEIYPHYVRQLEIDRDDGSERCYLTSEDNFNMLYRVYMCMTEYLNIDRIDSFNSTFTTNICGCDEIHSKYTRAYMQVYNDNANIFPVTYQIRTNYNTYRITNNIIIDPNYIDEYDTYNDRYIIPYNINIFVYKLPPLLIKLGIFFGKLTGPKYVNKGDIEHARIVLDKIHDRDRYD